MIPPSYLPNLGQLLPSFCFTPTATILAAVVLFAPIDNYNSQFLIADNQQPSPIPILEVIKVYGKLAGPDCFGQVSPKGSSCQVTWKDMQMTFGFNDGDDDEKAVLNFEEFDQALDKAEFQWPLKPYGVDKSSSKTATMNKGAETRIYMDELERRGLYDPRNPTGPLPTSLRPKLNKVLQTEDIEMPIREKTFKALGGQNGKLNANIVKGKFQDGDLDYYKFLNMIGTDSISWPY